MGFYEDNLEIIEQIKRHPEIVKELYQLHKDMTSYRLVGRSRRKNGRAFYSAHRQTPSGVHLGIKTGENMCLELEIATFHFLYDRFPSLRPNCPQVIALLDTDREEKRRYQTHWTVVMEDFSESQTLNVSDCEHISPAIASICSKPLCEYELENAIFLISDGTNLEFKVGDLGSLYPHIKKEFQREIIQIAGSAYANSRLEALVIPRK